MTDHGVVIVGSVIRIMARLLRAADRQTSSRRGHWAGVLNAYETHSFPRRGCPGRGAPAVGRRAGPLAATLQRLERGQHLAGE